MDMTKDHWWGFAALPDGCEYPYRGEDSPLTPVCQFSYENGMVYVFADLDYFFGDIEAEGGHVGEWDSDFFRVLYTGDLSQLHEHEMRYADGTSAVPEPKPMNYNESHVLGAPTCWQDELAQDYPGYQVLVQLEEDDNIDLRFYDCGTLFFRIKPEDLAAKRFDRVKCVLYSY